MHLRIDTEDRGDAIAILSALGSAQNILNGHKVVEVPAGTDTDATGRYIDFLEDNSAAQDQAIDAHMDERTFLRDQLRIAGRAIREAMGENTRAYQELGEARVFVEKAEALLHHIGITVELDDQGEPKLSVNIDEVLNYLTARTAA